MALVTFILLAPLAGFIILAGFYLAPNGLGDHISTILTNVLYTFFLSVTLVTAIFHILRGRNTTILPSIGSMWYKIYSKISLVRYGLFDRAYRNTKGIVILHTCI